ncbi:MAG: PKD domain-containing protein [Thermoplasmata archaeon]
MMLSPRLAALFIFCMLLSAMAIPFLQDAAAQDTTKPVIADITEGTPVTDGNFTVSIRVTDDYGVSTVHIYPHFIVPGGSIILLGILMEPMPDNVYETTLGIPFNATELKYSIIAKDYSLNPESTNVITRRVWDNIPPVAACEPTPALGMGTAHTFNGSASTDNVGIANYTWSFVYAGNTIKLYGPHPSFNFTQAGQYSGTLAVKDAWNNSDSAPFQVTVGDTGRPGRRDCRYECRRH